jgi:hypothetical protein
LYSREEEGGREGVRGEERRGRGERLKLKEWRGSGEESAPGAGDMECLSIWRIIVVLY